ncbi:hypothetical protein PVK06_045030 [Gossypium arboreum]|uniref:Uncharacterized protein n=1 Tax=Gossypium arboreum TaxID=29729 RepID=A0ABR0MUM2_GOSAR|nr:hypothetical protein PVK06_045030 [Gossypium arboreum]
METSSDSFNKDGKGEDCQNKEANSDVVMAVELDLDSLLSWKEGLLGESSRVLRGKNSSSGIEDNDDFTFME